jgi:hypothetical protein
MIVRIRFGSGTLVTHRKGKNGRAALLLASLLSLVAISFAVLGFWRLGEDLGIAGDFVFPTGLLSHWQVWIAAAASTQYGCWRLTRYSRLARREAVQAVVKEAPAAKVSARV